MLCTRVGRSEPISCPGDFEQVFYRRCEKGHSMAGRVGLESSKEPAMSDLTQVEIDRDVADVAAKRAAQQGLSVTAYISLLLRRSFERAPGEESVLVYDHVDDRGEFRIDREADEKDENYDRRSALYGDLFDRRR